MMIKLMDEKMKEIYLLDSDKSYLNYVINNELHLRQNLDGTYYSYCRVRRFPRHLVLLFQLD
jgi:hypothetical protein